jgi:hypothetical protein
MTDMNLQAPPEMPEQYASLAEHLTDAVHDATTRWPHITRMQVHAIVSQEINKALPALKPEQCR